MRPLIFLPLVCVTLVGAGCDDAAPVVDEVVGAECCAFDRDCVGSRCVRDDGGCGVCVPFICVSDADCATDERCDLNRGLCEVPLTCDGGAPDAGCDSAQQCLVTDTSSCRTPPSADSCALWPPSGPLESGVTVIELVGRGADGRLIPAGRATLMSTSGTVGSALPDQFFVNASCPGPERCEVTVTGALDTARCQARYTVLPAFDNDDARVVVRDADSGAALAGASVTVVAGDSVVAGRSDSDGVFFAPGVGDVDRVVIVNDGFDGVTCVDCDDDVAFALRRAILRGSTPAISGTMSVQGGLGDIVFGLGGLPLASPSFDAEHIFGVPGSAPFEVDGLTGEGDRMEFASGGIFTIGTTVVRNTFTAIGRPNQRSAWMVGSRIRIANIGPFLTQSDTFVDNRLELLRFAGPTSRSGLVGTVTSSPLALPDGPARLEDLSVNVDVNGLADVDVSAEVEVVFADAFPQGSTDVLIMVGAVVPGDGLIPLGGAVVALDDGVDRAVVPFAPPHDGLEGRAVRVVVVPTSGARLHDEDSFGGTRIIIPVASPGPDRTLVARIPDDLRLPAVVGVGEDTVIDAAVDADDLRHDVIVRLGDGRRHRIVAPASASLVLAPVIEEIEAISDADVDATDIDVGARAGDDDELAPWRNASFTRRR